MIDIMVNSERWFSLEDLPNEEWKDIIGFEKIYSVSNYGRVKSLGGVRFSNRYYKNGQKILPKILKCVSSRHGYYCTQIWVCGVCKTYRIHRLVAQAFIPNPNNKPQVNHINGIKTDNRVNNLEWCTNGENGKHAWDNNLRTKRFGKDNVGSKQVFQLSLDGNIIKKWDCIREASDAVHGNYRNIIACCKHKYGFKTYKGYIWKYVEEVEHDMVI